MRIRTLTYVFIALVLTLRTLPVSAQDKFQGDIDSYLRRLPRSLEFMYNSLSDGASVRDEINMFAEGFTENNVIPGGVFIPDFMDYNSKSAQFSVENYLLTFSNQYDSYISQGIPLTFEIANLNALDAYWTDDKKGIVLNVVYNNKLTADGQVVYQGKSQALLVFPKYSNTTDFLVKQLSSYKGNVSASTSITSSTAVSRSTSKQTVVRSSPASPIMKTGNAASLFSQAEKADKRLDYAKAISLYTEAINAGSAEAMVKMGMNYEYGYGDIIEKDFDKAASWYRLAAEAGNIEGCYHFAMCLRRGRGVNKDIGRARSLLDIAARKGHKQAAIELNKL